MDEKIKVAIGFVTGRPNVCKLINNMYKQMLEDRKSTRLNSSHYQQSRMPSSA